MKIERYQAYKNSGVEWLSEVPEHWEVARAKDICKIFVPQRDKPDLNEENGTAWITSDLLLNYSLDCSKLKYFVDEEEIKIKKIRKVPVNSVLASCIGEFSLTAINKFPVVINQQIQAYSCIKKQSSEFINYQIQASVTKRYYEITATETTLKYINKEKFSFTPLFLPPVSEQKAIAHYLDTKTAQIDRKIDLLTQKATLYSNLKQSLINETVTRGLDKSVPMKDSGIEWIGEVPEHWETRRINDIAVQSKRKNVGLAEKNLLSLSYGKLKRRDIDTSFGLLPESFETYQIVEAGNIILRLTDLQNDQRSLRVGLAKERGIITSAYLCLKFLRNVHPNFAYYLLFVYDISKVFYWFGGGLRQSMKFDDVKVFPFILPPLSEQKTIADYLDTKTAQIDQIIQTINTQIEKLKELRKTLINDVVTGKIRIMDNG